MRAPFFIYNNATGFMEARNANGSWAGPDNGWTEGMLQYIGMSISKLIIFGLNKVINGLIHLMWCTMFLP